MAKRYCEGCGRPLTYGQTFCDVTTEECIEKVRARLVSGDTKSARTFSELEGADTDSKGGVHPLLRNFKPFKEVARYDALGNRVPPSTPQFRGEGKFSETYKDAESVDRSAVRFPLLITQTVDAGFTTEKFTHLHLNFQGECLRVICRPTDGGTFVGGTSKASFRVRAGNQLTEASKEDMQPVEFFDQWKRWDFCKLTPSHRLSTTVKNGNPFAIDFSLIIFGRTDFKTE